MCWSIIIPGFVCSQCNNKYVDGMVECGICHRHLGEITDLSVIAEPDRLRRLAAREGRLPNIIVTYSHQLDSASNESGQLAWVRKPAKECKALRPLSERR